MIQKIFELLLTSLRSLQDGIESVVALISPPLDEEEKKRPLWKTRLLRLLFLPIWIFKALIAVLRFPFDVLFFEKERRNRFLRGIPALFGIAFTVATVVYILTTRGSVTDKYDRMMKIAIKKGDFKLASTLGGRLLEESSKLTPEIEFQYAISLMQSGDFVKANSMLQAIAPDSVPGYGPAHQLRAAQISKSLVQEKSAEAISALKWHLANSGGENNEQLHMLWAGYYQRVGQSEEAIKRLEQAATINPSHYLQAAELYRSLRNDAGIRRSLGAAQNAYQRLLDSNPSELKPRLQLALILLNLDQLENAETLLQNGLKISNASELSRMLAELYVVKYDRLRKAGDSLDKCFDCLEQSLRFDPNCNVVYDRLVQLYSSEKEKSGEDIVRLLESMIVDGKHAAIAHFALSSVLIVDGKPKEAQLHLKQAFELSPKMPVICNNLAWVLAHNDPPMLDQACELAMEAVKAAPDSAAFRDTLGTVYLKQGKYSDAVRELELALSKNNNGKEIHAKLAKAYYALGDKEISKMHWEKGKKD